LVNVVIATFCYRTIKRQKPSDETRMHLIA